MTAAGQRRTAARRTAGGENGTLGRGEGATGVLADSGSLCHHLAMETSTWPQLTVDSWTATRDTLHMWLQIVGKIQLESTPLINHWWNVTFEVSARGLRTRTMWQGDAAFDAEFDFVNHELVFRTVRGDSRSIALEPRTVADFYSATFGALQSLGIHVDISATPNEVAPAIAFAEDTTHHHYDPVAVHAFWRQLVASAAGLPRMESRFCRQEQSCSSVLGFARSVQRALFGSGSAAVHRDAATCVWPPGDGRGRVSRERRRRFLGRWIR